LRAEGLPHRREDARAVRRDDAQLHLAIDLRARVPRDLDAALGIGVERLRAAAPVNGETAPTRDEAEDVVARERIAAPRVANEHVVDAVQANAALVFSSDAANDRGELAFFDLGGRLRDRAILALRRGDIDDVLRRDLSVADRDEQLLLRAHLERLEELSKLVLVLEELVQRDPGLVQIALQQFSPE